MTDDTTDTAANLTSGPISPASQGQGRSEPSNRPRSQVASDLAGMAPWLQLGILTLGVLSALGVGSALLQGATFSPSLNFAIFLDALTRVLGAALLGWLIARLVRGLASALETQARRTESAEVVEQQWIAVLGRVAEALERSSVPAPPPHDRGREPAPPHPGAETCLRNQEVEPEHVGALSRVPNAPQPDGSETESPPQATRAEEVSTLRAKLDAAREVNDPDRVVELRDALKPLLDDESLRSLDKELARWLMGLIQKRLRAGTIRVDVVELATIVAEHFDHTAEGASLRASLPTLRRSAGLCARCAKPYAGIADACPECMTTQSFPAFGGPDFDTGTDPDSDSDLESTERDDSDRLFFSDDSV